MLHVKPILWVLASSVLVFVSVAAAVAAFNSQPVTFRVSASADTYLSASAPTEPQGSSATLWVAQSGSDGPKWTLLGFNLFGKLQPGDLIVDAKILLTTAAVQGDSWPAAVRSGRVLTSYSEANATWATAPMVVFDTSTTVVFSQPPGVGTQVSVDATKQLQRWHSYGGPSNYGTVLVMDPAVANAGVGFASRENADLAGPVLVVSYKPSPHGIYGYAIELANAAPVVRIR